MKLKFLILSTLATISLFGADIKTNLTVRSDVNSGDMMHAYDINSIFVFPQEDKDIIINPMISYKGGTDIGLSVGLGIKHAIDRNYFGYYLYSDYSFFAPYLLQQISPTVEFLTPKIDFRANFYLPVSDKNKVLEKSIKTHPTMFLEGTAKFLNLNASFGPTYDFRTKYVGARGGLIFPFENFDFGVTACLEEKGKHSVCAFFTVKIFGDKSKKNAPPYRDYSIKVKVKNTPAPIKEDRKQPAGKIPEVAPNSDSNKEGKKDSNWLFDLFNSKPICD